VLLRNVGGNRIICAPRPDRLCRQQTAIGAKVKSLPTATAEVGAGRSIGLSDARAAADSRGLAMRKALTCCAFSGPRRAADEIDLPRQPVIAMKEVDRRGSSCPVLLRGMGQVQDGDGCDWRGGRGVIGSRPRGAITPNPGEWING